MKKSVEQDITIRKIAVRRSQEEGELKLDLKI